MPAWAQRFRSDDLDEVRAFVARISGEHSRVAHRQGALGFDLAWAGREGVTIGWATNRIGMSVRGAVSEPTFHLMLPADCDYRTGRKQFVAGPVAAMFLAPGWEFTRRAPPGRALAVQVSARRLADEVAARLPERRAVLQFRTHLFDLSDAEYATLDASIREFAHSMASEPTRSGESVEQARLVAMLAGLLLRDSVAARADAVAASRMAKLEDWIESRIEEPITIGRLCEVAGVGERSLQKAFESRRGMSPMRFVTERRLARANRRLKEGGVLDEVTHVALGLGFRHMGRFALEYRAMFGESPSQTRSKAR